MLASVFELFPRQRKGIIIETPNEYDVLCGKDKTHSKHAGNQIYRSKIEQLASQYAAATTKQGKMYITRGIVESMQCTHGSRFLRQVNTGGNGNNPGWMELTDQQARDKTSHALRFYLKNKQRDTNDNDGTQPRTNTRRRQVSTETHPDLTESSIASSAAPTTVTSSSSMETPVQIAIPIDDPIFARQQALLQQAMFVTASPSVVDPMVVVSSTSASSASSNIPMAIAMDVDMSDQFDAMARSEDFSIFNGNTLRSEDLNALFNSSLSSVEAMMVVSGAASEAHPKTSTDTMRSEDLNYIFSLQDYEWDEVMKD